MSNKKALSNQLIQLLARVDFANRYYKQYETHKNREGKSDLSVDQEVIQSVISEFELNFEYNQKESFFEYQEVYESCNLVFNIAFPYSTVEFILYVKTKHSYIGGPFPKLARQIGKLSDPDFSPSPSSPKIPFSDADELKDVIQFGIDLFEDAKQEILAYGGWNI